MGDASLKATGVARLKSGISDFFWHNRGRWGKFASLIAIVCAVSLIASLITRLFIIEPDRTPSYHLAVIAPQKGIGAIDSDSLIKGARLAVAQINENGGVNGKYFDIVIYDSAENVTQAAKSAIDDEKTIAAIIGGSTQTFEQVNSILNRAGILSILPTQLSELGPQKSTESLVMSLGYSRSYEARFMANYVRNVLGEVLVSTITDQAQFDAEAQLFKGAFERFGAPLARQWVYNSKQGNISEQFAKIVQEVKQDNTAGALYLSMSPDKAAILLAKLRQAGVANEVIGGRDLAGHSFTQNLPEISRDRLLNGVHATAPIMADIAGAQVQKLRSLFYEKHAQEADWIALMAAQSGFAIANMLSEALGDASSQEGAATLEASSGEASSGLRGVLTDYLQVNPSATSIETPIWVGRYDGRNFVSALTQLQPIGEGEVDNYIKSVREGRALYVNDRFMYKTNMVYTGLIVREIRNLDHDAGTFEMDFALWFRYRGKAVPQDIVFANAAEPIELGEPAHQETQGDLKYVGYELTGKFSSNFQDVGRSYGQDLLGTNFRHRLLDKNNLRYVVDLVGMGLLGDQSLQQKLSKSHAITPSVDRVLKSAWVSQSIEPSESLGTLTFVGNGKPTPDFSKIMFAMVVSDDKPSLTDFVPREYLVYILLFGITGSIAAIMMDRHRVGRRFFWNVQSWLLRAVCWPLAIISAGTLILDTAFGSLDFAYIDILVAIYRIALWLAGTALIVMAVNRFIWSPLEDRTRRRVPGSIRAIVSIVIYMLAIVGVLSYVFGMNVTSILAASGVLSLVLGLALQNNIANIFSGIVLNLERPFEVGDILRLPNGTEAEVMDITWRSIRVQDIMGVRYSIPNSVATNQEMTRICRAYGDAVYQSATISVAPKHDPELVVNLLWKAVGQVTSVAETPAPAIRYNGANQTEFANYVVRFASPEYYDAPAVSTEVWNRIWNVLGENGIEVSTLDSPSLAAAIKRRSA